MAQVVSSFPKPSATSSVLQRASLSRSRNRWPPRDRGVIDADATRATREGTRRSARNRSTTADCRPGSGHARTRSPLIAVDSSVVIAAFASWHELHEPARRVLDGGPKLPAHAALESYAALTRLPAPQRAPGQLVLAFLADRFPDPYLSLSSKQLKTFIHGLAARGISAAASYDALIATVAAEVRATLVSCDGRAASTYEACGASSISRNDLGAHLRARHPATFARARSGCQRWLDRAHRPSSWAW
jgi:predicted nucleic acid-binding protein